MPREKTFLPPKPGKEKLLIPLRKSQQSQQNPGDIGQALKAMHGGEIRTGFLGTGDIVRKPDTLPEVDMLDAEGVARKKAIQALLAKVIQPNSLSNKSSKEQDKRSLVFKLSKCSMRELMRLLPEVVACLTTRQMEDIANGITNIAEADEAGIQERYIDLSP